MTILPKILLATIGAVFASKMAHEGTAPIRDDCIESVDYDANIPEKQARVEAVTTRHSRLLANVVTIVV